MIQIVTITTKIDNLATNGLEETLSFGTLFLKMIIALIIVCLLAYIIMKWALPKAINIRGGHKGIIKIIDYFRLEPKKTLYIIEVKGKYLLLGVTDQYISPLTIAQLDEEEIKNALASYQKEDTIYYKKFLIPGILQKKTKEEVKI